LQKPSDNLFQTVVPATSNVQADCWWNMQIAVSWLTMLLIRSIDYALYPKKCTVLPDIMETAMQTAIHCYRI